jgi:predicted acetyltransferase
MCGLPDAYGINLPDGFVPSTTLLLVEGDQLLGVTNLRAL